MIHIENDLENNIATFSIAALELLITSHTHLPQHDEVYQVVMELKL